ncbi:urease accessory protein UreF [Tropicibacter sp. Alg240-R139]|uniref:urease accessory protein UreF n=1 Tax=Tropicibacter sp. Alg240-R139 TaxID=2305991 RepID=UPI0013DF3FE3|nr:urease accessory protein UreF [Tropicibacter sp. Alg240-R139]
MATPTDILTLGQWFSPAFPVGAFAYSHGLERSIDQGQVRTADDVQDWLDTVLHHGSVWNDTVLLASAYRAETPEELIMIDATCRALAASRERLMESDLQGSAFCAAVRDVWPVDLSDLTYPVAVGRAARLMDLPLELTAQMYVQAFVSNLAAAAVRLVPLGQTDGQRIVKHLTPACRDIAAKAVQADADDLRACSYVTDIAAMNHETQYSRIFRT